MTNNNIKEQWKIEVNDRYQRVVGIIMGLSTGSLVLPVLFLGNFISVPANGPLLNYLSGLVYWSWILLGLSVLSGIVFYYVSAKWIKHAWGQKTYISSKTIEGMLDWSFWIEIVAFFLGIGLFLLFAITYKSC